MRELRRIRRPDGAGAWGIFEDVEQSNQYVETFVLPSWLEHLRQQERQINSFRDRYR
jgi:hypothetical protein